MTLFVVPYRQATSESILDSLNVYKSGLRLLRLAESIPGVLKHLQVRAQVASVKVTAEYRG
jgi:hypothetical protein